MINETEQEKTFRYLKRMPFYEAEEFVDSVQGAIELSADYRKAIQDIYDVVVIPATGWTWQEIQEEIDRESTIIQGERMRLYQNIPFKKRMFYVKQRLGWVVPSFRQVIRILFTGNLYP